MLLDAAYTCSNDEQSFVCKQCGYYFEKSLALYGRNYSERAIQEHFYVMETHIFYSFLLYLSIFRVMLHKEEILEVLRIFNVPCKATQYALLSTKPFTV